MSCRIGVALSVFAASVLTTTIAQAQAKDSSASAVSKAGAQSPLRTVDTAAMQVLAENISTVDDILRALSIPPKGEFETTARYRARVVEQAGLRKVLSVKVDDPNGTFMSYDADTGRLRINLDVRNSGTISLASERHTGLVIEHKSRQTGEHQGSNAYGATVTVTSYHDDLCLLIPSSHSLDGKYIVTLDLKMPPDSARRYKKDLALLAVFSPTQDSTGAITSEGSDYSEATISSPTEIAYAVNSVNVSFLRIYLYDRASRRVLHRWQI